MFQQGKNPKVIWGKSPLPIIVENAAHLPWEGGVEVYYPKINVNF